GEAVGVALGTSYSVERRDGRGRVPHADPREQRAAVGLRGALDDRHIEPAETQEDRREDPHRPGAGHDRAPWFPDGHTPLRGADLSPSFLTDGERLEKHGHGSDLLRYGEEVVGSLGVALRAEAVQSADAAFRVLAPETHVRFAARPIGAAIGTAHARDHQRGFDQPHALTGRARAPCDPTDALVTEDQKAGA